MPSPLEQVAWEPCVLEPQRDRALEAYARRKMGMPSSSTPYFTPAPWLARALVDLHPEYGLLLRLDHGVMDLVNLVVCQENSCRFCYAAVRAMLWAQGLSRERIERMERDLLRADLPPRTLAAMAFGRTQSRTGPTGASAARDALARAGVEAEEMREIAFAAALVDFSNRAHTIAAVPVRPMERMPDQLHTRLLRPLVNYLIRRSRSHGRPQPLSRVPEGPHGRLIQAYAGSPIAPVLAEALDAMWASPILTRRCKLLVFAVVARGLDCEACGPEIGEALRKEGLTDEAIAAILTHLDGPELDSVERQVVSFARETIWYEPAVIQRRARALRGHLTGAQLVEAIGVAALANGLCRLGATVLEPAEKSDTA
jgi:alkylhydroperoxidase family enzyme